MLMALLACTAYAGNAAAAGPSSVLLVTPASGRTASLYATDGDYGRLQDLLDSGGAANTTRRPGLETAMRARQLTVTWLVDDVEPWRLQQVYVPADGGPVWVHTAPDVPRSYEGSWHRARQPRPLTGLLTRLGLLAPPHRAGAGGGEPLPPGSRPPARAQDPTADIDPSATDPSATGPAATGAAVPPDSPLPTAAPVLTVSGWWWALPGAAAGAAGAVLYLRLRERRAQGPDGQDPPGQDRQLIDL
ncbi:hypothetical protein ACH4SP_23230 [Streptomyces sp. NPDC021093]|uniref:hypothetical protein n=1 Tax=Streptomyces sp. NPDC021093 TaxID=3365112 RepID=UPI00379AC623